MLGNTLGIHVSSGKNVPLVDTSALIVLEELPHMEFRQNL